MIPGEVLLPPTQQLDNAFFIRLKEKQCAANPNLAGFMSKTLTQTTADETTIRRLIRMALIALEIIGAGEETDKDYVRVSKKSIEEAPVHAKLDVFEIMEANEDFAKAYWEAQSYVEAINELLNNFYDTSIETRYVLDNIQVLFKAYWIETLKSK